MLSGCSKSETGDEISSEETPPTATVVTVALKRESIVETITAYGNVVAQSGKVESLSVQYESKVVRLLVSAGEPIAKSQALIEIEPSPDAKLALEQAQTAARSAQTQLEQTQKRFAMKLAVNSELQQAEQTAQDATAKFASLENRGAGDRATLKTDFAGIVATIDVTIGQIVAAGAPLLSLLPENQIEVRLGAQPEDTNQLTIGQAVQLTAVNQGGVEMTGEIRLITRRVNPETRLIDIFVTVPPEASLLLDGYVRAEIQTGEKQAFVVPREAILPGDDGAILYTLVNGHAVAHKIVIGLETDTKTEVIGDTLNVGDQVVTVGNSQLENGMAATSQPNPADNAP